MPRITPHVEGSPFQLVPASMRPGRNAPDNKETSDDQRSLQPGFNEAGAKCPG